MIEPDSPSGAPEPKFFKQIGIYVDVSIALLRYFQIP